MNQKYFTGIIRILARYLLYEIYAGLIVITLLGCGKQPSEKTLRLAGLGGRPAPINPILTNQTVSMAVTELVFNRLVRINSRMLPEPDLAESWQVSPDGLVYTFQLRKGVRFHDRVEFTAEDCVFTYNAVLSPANNSPWRDNYIMIKDIKVQDRHTFVVRLNEPQASFINLMNLPIIPQHLLDGEDIRTADFNRHPVGTGPFRFVEWTADNRIILEANPDYYEGRPQIDRIIATGYDTFSEYFSAFIKQETDAAFFLNQEQFETVRRDQGFRTYVIPFVYTYAIDYNPEHPLFKSKKVRQAITHTLNIPEIINKVESGYGVQSTGPFLPGAWFSDPAVKPIEYDPALALKLLKDERWEMKDDRVLKKDGQEFRFTLLVDPKERITETIAKIIYRELFKVGIRCEIKTYDHSQQDKELIQQAGAAVISIRILADLEPSWHSDKQHRTGKLWRYLSPEIDRLFEQANRTQDLQKRKMLYHQLQRMVYDEQPGTFLYYHPNLCAVSARFTNSDELFSPAMPFYTIKDWKISSSSHPERSKGSLNK